MMLCTLCSRAFRNLFLSAAAVGALLAFGGDVRAALLAYEAFDYDNQGDGALLGKSGGFGWGDAWEESTVNTGGASIFQVSQDDTSLNSPANPHAPLGDRVSADGADIPSGTGWIVRHLTEENEFDLGQNGVLYASFLLQKNGEFPTPGSSNNMEFGLGWNDGTNGMFRFGSSSGNLFLFNGGGGNIIEDDVTQNTTYFLVMKVDAHAATDDVISGMIFAPGDTVPASEPLTWDRTQSIDSAEVVDRIRLWMGANAAGQFDEIRIGNTWTSVAVPEPHFFSLLGIGLAGMGMLGLRRQR